MNSHIPLRNKPAFDDNDLSMLVVCPFDSNHQVSRRKLQYHISKCVKSYKGNKVPCPYNASEYIEPEVLSTHLMNCPSMWDRVSHKFSMKHGTLVSNDKVKNKVEAPFTHSEIPPPTECWGLE